MKALLVLHVISSLMFRNALNKMHTDFSKRPFAFLVNLTRKYGKKYGE